MSRADDDRALALDSLAFLGPFSLVGRGWLGVVGQVPGVYVLRSVGPDGAPVRVPRAGDTDDRGVLDIGESGRLRGRLDDLRGACLGQPRSHRAGWDDFAYDVGARYPAATLCVEVLPIPIGRRDARVLAEALELALLESYRGRFKDRPPLNASAGKYRKVSHWLTSLGRAPRDASGWLDLSGLLDGLAVSEPTPTNVGRELT